MVRKRRSAGSRRRSGEASDGRRPGQQAISGAEVVAAGVLHLARNSPEAASSSPGGLGGRVAAVGLAAVRGTIRATSEVGGDIGLAARHAVRGAIHAAQEVGSDPGEAARAASGAAVATAVSLGGDVARVAYQAVEGAIGAARHLGADVTRAARRAAAGAIEVATRTGGAAPHTVRAMLSGSIAGVPLGASSPTGRRPTPRARLPGPAARGSRARRPRPAGDERPVAPRARARGRRTPRGR
jgi:hypothetical protein